MLGLNQLLAKPYNTAKPKLALLTTTFPQTKTTYDIFQKYIEFHKLKATTLTYQKIVQFNYDVIESAVETFNFRMLKEFVLNSIVTPDARKTLKKRT